MSFKVKKGRLTLSTKAAILKMKKDAWKLKPLKAKREIGKTI